MSVAKTKQRWFRVYSADRKCRKAVGANTLAELTTEARRKLCVDGDVGASVVLEEDGTCVDEEEYFQHGLECNDVLMLLRDGEAWTEYRAAADGDADETDCGPATEAGEHRQLRQLCSRLCTDLKEILLFSTDQHRVLIDADKTRLRQLLHRDEREVEQIQTACQRYVDEMAEYHDAVGLLGLIRRNCQTQHGVGDNSQPGVGDSNDGNCDDDSDLAAKRPRTE